MRAVKSALSESDKYQDQQVIGAILETNRSEWDRRKSKQSVIDSLLHTNHFYFSENGQIDATDYFDETILRELMTQAGSLTSKVQLIEPFDPASLDLPEDTSERLKICCEEILAGDADGVMIDTPVSAKSARICLLNHELNAKDIGKDKYGDNLPSVGIFDRKVIEKHSDYAQFLAMESWLAGSIQPYHARDLGEISSVDVIVCRGAASAVYPNPFSTDSGGDQRYQKRIDRAKVAALRAALDGTENKEI